MNDWTQADNNTLEANIGKRILEASIRSKKNNSHKNYYDINSCSDSNVFPANINLVHAKKIWDKKWKEKSQWEPTPKKRYKWASVSYPARIWGSHMLHILYEKENHCRGDGIYPPRVLSEKGWKKLERSYVRAVIISDKKYNKVQKYALELFARYSTKFNINEIFIQMNEDWITLELNISVTKKITVTTILSSRLPDFRDPTIIVATPEESKIYAELDKMQGEAQSRKSILRSALENWVFIPRMTPNYQNIQYRPGADSTCQDRIDSDMITVHIKGEDGLPDRMYVGTLCHFRRSDEIQWPIFWPHGRFVNL